MAKSGKGYFDRRGQFFRTPEEATASDLASILGRIGDGDSLAPGIAIMLLEKREEIEQIFAEHDEMREDADAQTEHTIGDNVTPLPSRH